MDRKSIDPSEKGIRHVQVVVSLNVPVLELHIHDIEFIKRLIGTNGIVWSLRSNSVVFSQIHSYKSNHKKDIVGRFLLPCCSDVNSLILDYAHAFLNSAWIILCAMSRISFRGVDLRYADLSYVNFTGANLREATS